MATESTSVYSSARSANSGSQSEEGTNRNVIIPPRGDGRVGGGWRDTEEEEGEGETGELVVKERGAIYVPSNPRTLLVREHERPVRENFVPFVSWSPFVNGRISVDTLDTLHGYG